MNRGSAARRGARSVTAKSLGFNEAPIHESGKSVSVSCGSLARIAGFNEAPIHESGK